jgi:hypothetical protein
VAHENTAHSPSFSTPHNKPDRRVVTHFRNPLHRNEIPKNAMLETDYNRYFSTKMVVYLINMSGGKDSEHYESLSGTITSINNDVVSVRMPYKIGRSDTEAREGNITYKLLSEVLGVGVQVLADLTKVENDVVHLRLRGNLEIFQRRNAARVDTTIKLYKYLKGPSIESYRVMYNKLTSCIEGGEVPSEIKMEEAKINLSASGLRCTLPVVTGKGPPPLSMFLLALEEKKPLICTVAELIWTRDNALENISGYRFIIIRKQDRNLIARYVRSIAPEQELQDDYKKNWELLDSMSSEER